MGPSVKNFIKWSCPVKCEFASLTLSLANERRDSASAWLCWSTVRHSLRCSSWLMSSQRPWLLPCRLLLSYLRKTESHICQHISFFIGPNLSVCRDPFQQCGGSWCEPAKSGSAFPNQFWIQLVSPFFLVSGFSCWPGPPQTPFRAHASVAEYCAEGPPCYAVSLGGFDSFWDV